MPTISSRSHDSKACWAAGLPINPLWPTSKRLSRSRPSLALSVRTIGAASRSASASDLARGRGGRRQPTSRVTFPASSIAAAAAASCDSSGVTGTLVRANRGGVGGASSAATSPGRVSTATPGRPAPRWIACSRMPGSCSGAVIVRQNSATSRNTASLSTSWKKSDAELGERHLAADREHRRVRLLRVVEPVEQVDGARTDRAHADAERPGQLGLGAGGERAGLLVPYADPLQAVVAADRVGDRVQGVADDAPDRSDAEVGKRVDDRLGDRARDDGVLRGPCVERVGVGALPSRPPTTAAAPATSWPGSSQSYSSA